MKTPEEFLELYYRNHKKRIAYPDNVCKAMEQFAKEVAIDEDDLLVAIDEDDLLIEFVNWYNIQYPERFIYPKDIINYLNQKNK